MISRVLIANRGEIALRILRACRTLGVEAVVAYSEADRESLPASSPTRRSASGPADATRSYLSAPALISAALVTGCDAVHPGYGFLSEDDAFADAVRAHGLTFIGPPADVLERFASRRRPAGCSPAHGLPTIPGSAAAGRRGARARGGRAHRLPGAASSRPRAAAARACAWSARRASWPQSSRSAAPRRGPRSATTRCTSRSGSRTTATSRSRSRSTASATASTCGERDCSVQRRHQKILEEAPTPAMSAAGRRALAERAIRAVVAAGYENVGTLEFLVDGDGNAYFIEINCRIQVEHPVTEMLTGHRPRRDADPDRRRRAAGLHPGGRQPARPRDRVPDQRRGPGARLPPRRRRDRAVPRAGRPGRPLRLAPVHRLRGAALLRLAARQADRLGTRRARRRSPAAGPRSTSSSSTAS